MPKLLSSLRLPAHPRLFLTPERITSLRRQIATGGDPISSRLYRHARASADALLPLPPLERVMEGYRLLAVSRGVMSRVLHLGIVAVLGDSAAHARRAIDELLAAAAFADWNPSHYLDTAEMTLALAVGYDWLHDRMTPAERDRIADAILDKGVRVSLGPAHEQLRWIDGTNNWTQVCHAGMAAGALAVAERDPGLAVRIVNRAMEKVPLAAHAYGPDGAYAEGTMYWGYGTGFHVMLIDLLTTALGQDGGLAEAPGFLASARYMHEAVGPGGGYFNYSDARETRGFSVPMFWFARRLDEPALVADNLTLLAADRPDAPGTPAPDPLENDRTFPLALVWWNPEFTPRLERPSVEPPRHWHARGEVPLGVHRSAWHDPAATWVALKGGCPSAPHGHMDGGVFVLEAGGVRWAADLGMQEYHSLEKLGVALWDGKVGGGRWTVFRVGGASHNILAFNGAPQILRGRAPLVRFSAGGDWPHTAVDLSALYADHARRAWRGIALGNNGQVVLQDEWTAGLAVDVRWQMLTHAQEIDLGPDGRTVTLRQAGKAFVLRIEANADFRAEVVDVSRPVHDYDAPNPGARQLVLHTHTRAGSEGGFRLVGALAGTAAADAPLPPYRPLTDWSAPDPELANVS